LPREGRGHGAEGRSSEYAGTGKKGIAEEFSSVDHATIYIGILESGNLGSLESGSLESRIPDSEIPDFLDSRLPKFQKE
jgi:hypothetical protein